MPPFGISPRFVVIGLISFVAMALAGVLVVLGFVAAIFFFCPGIRVVLLR